MKRLKVLGVIAAMLGCWALLLSYSAKKEKPSFKTALPIEARDMVAQKVVAAPLNASYSFAGEELPMDNFDVKERLDRELQVNTYWHSSTLFNIKLSTRYFPLMDKILKEEGVPTDFKYLAVAESGLRHVTSPAGAKGLWQFMKGTAGDYNMEVNSEVDERYHVEKSTYAACKMLKKLKNRLGSWTLAAAAYNMGGGGLSRDMENQEAETYYDLNLNEETARYIFRIVAMKTIMENPQKFGFYFNESDYYPPLDNYTEVKVDGAVNSWGAFAKKHNTTYRMLKVYNPWLRSHKLTNKKKKTYWVKIPK